MEPFPLGTYTPYSSKKRVFTGSGDCSSMMDEDVVEIPPPPSFSKSKSSKQKQKQKQAICPEVIDVDNDEDEDLMIIEDFVHSKGKSSMKIHLSDLSDPTDTVNVSKGVGSISHSSPFEGESGHDMNYWDDYYGDFNGNAVIVDDECAMLQAHFDSIDVPPGVEAAIPWWPSSEDSKQGVSASNSAFITPSSFSNAGTSKTDASQSLRTYKDFSKTKTRSVKAKRFVTISGEHPYGAPWQPASSYPQQQSTSWSGLPPPPPLKSSWPPFPSFAQAEDPLPTEKKISFGEHPFLPTEKKYSFGANQPFSGWSDLGADKLTFPHLTHSSFAEVATVGFAHYQDPSVVLDQGIAAEISVPSDLASSDQQDNGEALNVKRLESFKKFDTVQDHSDHHHSRKKHSQPSKAWVKKIQEEWRILEKDLPDTIFVRVYETRMDLLRAAIVGADGTPYHDGIFFFDVHFPSNYPNVPPLVYYHSGGLRLNPNLYNCGKVCLSLLNTWSGSSNEKWVPGLSTTLQVLVSIQGLILNAKPYFNEPGYVGLEGSPAGEKQSEVYNENTFLLSLKTMLYSMRRPPKYFDDLVYGHFYKHAHEILIACKAYLDGAQVGTLVKGGIQDVDAGDKSCSNTFKMHLPVYINSLVKAFTNVGVQDCEKYSVPINESTPVAEAPSSSRSRMKLASSYRRKVALKMKMNM